MNHICTATKCHDSSIFQLVSKYNKLVDEIQTLIHQKGASRGTWALLLIEYDGLFALDVDFGVRALRILLPLTSTLSSDDVVLLCVMTDDRSDGVRSLLCLVVLC